VGVDIFIWWAASPSTGVVGNMVEEHGVRWSMEHFYRGGFSCVCDHISQGVLGQWKHQDRTPVFATRGWGVVSILFIVGFAVLREVTVLDDGETKQQSVFVGGWSKEGAPAVDRTKEEVALAYREG
jgi:hypothetical protein